MKNWKKIRESGLENQLLAGKFLIREKVMDAVRKFFKNAGFREVETPLLVQSPGTEPYLEVFESELVTPGYDNKKSYLLTSPELSMKKLLSAGLGNIFQICKSFRNGEGLSSFHNPEFTILEWYRVKADYLDIMKDCENLFLFILNELGLNEDGKNTLIYQGIEYDLSTPWERISVSEAFKKYAGMSIEEMLDSEKLVWIAKEKGYEVDDQMTWEQAYNQILLNEIEPFLGKKEMAEEMNTSKKNTGAAESTGKTKPTILYDYPAYQAALSKKKNSDPRFAERFEFYIGGIELGNAFSELTDAGEQEARMIDDLNLRKKLGKTEYKMDKDSIEALELGMPQTGGIAVGVDRLVMLFADAGSIKETLFFPVEDVFDY
ncbi:EF-P lysine aminoacylase GenX [Patescibacteria group bacterium]|nr:EF-P lysine aminoacylase GenX [Patescibacteria group bacterium]